MAAGAQDFPVAVGASAGAAYKKAIRNMGFDQKLGSTVEKDAEVYDETGAKIKFGSLLGKRPVLLLPMFYTCKSACGLEVDGVVKGIVGLNGMSAGEQFDVVFLSINPLETPDLAMAKKQSLLKIYDRPEAAKGLHFLTGSYENVSKITRSIGFRYVWRPETAQVYHPTGLVILTKDGKASRYFYGTEYPSKQLQAAFNDGAQNKIGLKSEEIMMGCIMVDPVTGARSLNIMRIIQIFGFLTVAVLFGSIAFMSYKHRRPGGTPSGF